MRILFCTNSLGAAGGIERVTIVKANALADIDGNEVAICFTDRGTYPEQTIHPLSPKVKVYDLGVTFWDLHPFTIKTLLSKAPKKFAALRRSLIRVITDFNADVVITTGSYEKYALASLRLKHAIKVREYHFNSNYRRHLDVDSPLLNLTAWVDNNVLSHFFDKSFLLTKENLETCFKGNKRFDYQHNPCSFVGLTAADTEREKVVVAVGRLSQPKNYGALLRIWAKAIDRMPGWRLEIVGDGEERDYLERQSKDLGLESTVEFLGFRRDVRDIMLRSKVIALTSKHEGFPLNLIEALAAGTVPVAYAFPFGARDAIIDGKCGVLVDYLDEEQFAERLVALVNDESMLKRMSAAAIERAKAFDISVISQQWMQKYDTLLRHKRK